MTRDDLTELLAMMRGEDFVFDPGRLACASETLQRVGDEQTFPADREDFDLAVCALEALYRHLNRMVAA